MKLDYVELQRLIAELKEQHDYTADKVYNMGVEEDSMIDSVMIDLETSVTNLTAFLEKHIAEQNGGESQ